MGALMVCVGSIAIGCLETSASGKKYKPAVQRKGNEADHQENGNSTSHVTAFPVNNNTSV